MPCNGLDAFVQRFGFGSNGWASRVLHSRVQQIAPRAMALTILKEYILDLGGN